MTKQDPLASFSSDSANRPKTPAEVAEQDALNDKAKISFKSKDDADNIEFKALEEDVFYKLCVESAVAREFPKYQEEGTELKIMITFIVEERVDGEPIKDIDGAVQENGQRRFWEFLSTESTGFWHGKPSKTRACICALLNQDPEEEFEFNDLNDLVGKECQARFEYTIKKDGTTANKVNKYKPVE